jgi:predicted transcriptional regulator
MKAILFASVMTLLYAAVVTVIFRVRPVTRRAAVMFWLFWLSSPLFLVGYILAPANFWVLPEVMVEPLSWIDLGFSYFVYGALVFGGILQLYNLADRGFSLRILIDILESPTKSMSVDDIMRGYGAGAGVSWMFDKRIEGIADNGLAVQRGGQLVITQKGKSVARVFGALRQFLNLPGPDRKLP